MWPSSSAPPGAYRLTTTRDGALEALAQGDYPLLFPADAPVPDLRTVIETAERQWAAPDGEPMFTDAAEGGGLGPNWVHPVWSQLRDRE
jgi:hypothetical protein